jgi:hypothetical protein
VLWIWMLALAPWALGLGQKMWAREMRD